MQSCQPTAELRLREIQNLVFGELKTESCDGVGLYPVKQNMTPAAEKRKEKFIQYPLYVLCLIFNVAAIMFTFLAMIFSCVYLLVPALFPFRSRAFHIWWHLLAIFSGGAGSITWNRQYEALRHNIAVTETIRDWSTFHSHTPNCLGLSFHLTTVSIVLLALNLMVLLCVVMGDVAVSDGVTAPPEGDAEVGGIKKKKKKTAAKSPKSKKRPPPKGNKKK